MTRAHAILMIALLAFTANIACSAGHLNGSDARSAGPLIAPMPPADGSTRDDDPSDSRVRPIAIPAPSAAPAAAEACPVTRADRLETLVRLAIDGLALTTSADGWSRACAQLHAFDGAERLHTVTIKVGWMGTLHDYASIRGASPILGLADEAYAWDAGRRIALRSGELVAVVRYAGGTPSETETVARLLADQLRE